MNTIKYEASDGIIIGVFIWMVIIGILILAPYVLSGILFKQNSDLKKRVTRLERQFIENAAVTNQIQAIE